MFSWGLYRNQLFVAIDVHLSTIEIPYAYNAKILLGRVLKNITQHSMQFSWERGNPIILAL